ncbi:MAG: hypothetical protein IKQ51_11325 [Bacteroidaceae bacterium]|nr:hypothetical protein [Bacteroidaceae bacterium]
MKSAHTYKIWSTSGTGYIYTFIGGTALNPCSLLRSEFSGFSDGTQM